MTYDELNEYIKHYIEKDKTKSAIMLTGAWGTGKSYYIHNFLKPFLKEPQNGKHRCATVSLYGLNNISEISKRIYFELRTIGSSKKSEALSTTKAAATIVAKTVFNGMTNMIGFDIGRLSDEDLENVYSSVDLSNALVVFEDLERSNIDIIEILGYVNSLTEQDGAKVLLIANEDEIKKTTIYLRAKEKTISNTIFFIGDYENAIKNIISDFENGFFKRFVSDENAKKILEIMNRQKNHNLRLFTFACQKIVDIFEIICDLDGIEYPFAKSIFWGIINFIMQIEDGEYPDWEDNSRIEKGHIFFPYRLYDYPLYRFCYDYIIWQKFDIEMARETLIKFKQQRLFESDEAENNQDLNVIFHYYIHTEPEILRALENIENQLCNFDDIPFHSYKRLAYCLIRCNTILNFNYNICKQRMINNINKICDQKNEISTNLFSNIYISFDFENDEEKIQFSEFSKQLSEAFNSTDLTSKIEYKFSYNTNDLHELFRNVKSNLLKVISNHKFISEFDFENLVNMVLECNPSHLQTFRNILSEVYEPTNIKAFLKEDFIFMNKLKIEIEAALEKRASSMDRMKLYQMKCLINNLEEFARQLNTIA